jgi:hypothetical protein
VRSTAVRWSSSRRGARAEARPRRLRGRRRNDEAEQRRVDGAEQFSTVCCVLSDCSGSAGASVAGRNAEGKIDDELRLVLAMLDDLPAAVVLQGEAGIGKTSIWHAAIAEL